MEPPKQKIHYELRVDDKVDNPLEYPPLDLHDAGRGQLLMSPKLVTCLNDLAVDNVQYIPAEAVYVPSRAVVPYQLGNILGLVKALDVAASDCEVDEDGFMEEPDVWNEEVALALASTEGVNELTENHWKVVTYLREYYLEFSMAPMIRKLCKSTGFKLKEIYDLFPSGPAKGACKVAGLPKPTGCV